MNHTPRTAAALFAGLVTMAAATASAQQPTYSLADNNLVVTLGAEQTRVALGCAGRKLLQHGQKLYVACGAQGVVVLSLAGAAPVISGRQPTVGSAMGFFVQDGQVWVKIARLEARPVGAAPALPPTTTPATDPEEPGVRLPKRPRTAPVKKPPTARLAPRKERPTGRVIKIGLSEVLINLGKKDGLRRDDRIELFVRHKVKMGGEAAAREEVLVVGKVSVVSNSRAKVRLGTNERVPRGAGARLSQRKVTESIVAPPRVGRTWEVKANLRPLIPLGSLGFGLFLDASAAYRFEAPVVLRLLIEPFAFAATEDKSPVVFSGHFMAGLDLRLFELGFGIGVSTVNEERDTDVAFSIHQGVRLGALDGLHLEVHNTLLVYDSEFHYGATQGTIQIPLASSWWLLFRGGGGMLGSAHGEGGLRIRLRGNGRHKSVFITATIGWGMVYKDYPRQTTSSPTGVYVNPDANYNGPTVGLGIEWRP